MCLYYILNNVQSIIYMNIKIFLSLYGKTYPFLFNTVASFGGGKGGPV